MSASKSVVLRSLFGYNQFCYFNIFNVIKYFYYLLYLQYLIISDHKCIWIAIKMIRNEQKRENTEISIQIQISAQYFYNIIFIEDHQDMINKQSTDNRQPQDILSQLYMDACRKAFKTNYNKQEHVRFIKKSLKQCKFSYKVLFKCIVFSKQDFIQDLIEVSFQMRTILENHNKNYQKFMRRSRKHFGGQHYNYLSKNCKNQKRANNVIKMYENQTLIWNQYKQNIFANKIYKNSAYFMGLIKGNGLLINKNHIVSCAHVFIDDATQNIMRLRCFAVGSCGYGVALISQNGIFKENDVGYGKVIKYQGPQIEQIQLTIPPALKFAQQFKPISVLQVGVLFIPDQLFQTFQTAQGFIERNQYQNMNDLSLNQQRGLLIHNCYGMWGTSGSPLWNNQGQIIGIHNAWNQEGHNVSMIVHDSDDQDDNKCRVIRQYQRRAVSVHVLKSLYEEWQRKGEQEINLQRYEVQKKKIIKKAPKPKFS